MRGDGAGGIGIESEKKPKTQVQTANLGHPPGLDSSGGCVQMVLLLLASRLHTRVHSRPPSLYKQPDEEIAFHLEKRIVGLLRR
jgi:hypothetical protein